MPEPVRLELDLAQLINDHRPNLRGAHPLFVLVLAAFNVVRLEHLTVGLGNYRLDIGTPTLTSSGVNELVNNCGRM